MSRVEILFKGKISVKRKNRGGIEFESPKRICTSIDGPVSGSTNITHSGRQEL